MYVAVSGNIGSGKTSLTEILAARFGADAHFENVDNPYINDFYADMGRWAFNFQVHFLAGRIRQSIDALKGGGDVIQDRTIHEDAHIFAANLHEMGLMSSRDFATYMNIYDLSNELIRTPDLLIYLRASVPKLIEQIRKRGRPYEQRIEESYLGRLNEKYEQWIGELYTGPVMVIDIDKNDFLKNNATIDEISAGICAACQR